MTLECKNCGRTILSEADMYIYQHRPTEEYISCGCKEITQPLGEIRKLIEEYLIGRGDTIKLKKIYQIASAK